jgi:HAD superfamily hydrolase (TIGR01509 family)
VTFDLWQTLIYDESELDQTRMEMRCEGLRKVLSGFGIELSLESLLDAHEKSAQLFQVIWGKNEEISTIDQVELIIRNAAQSSIDLPLDSRTNEMLRNAYTDPLFTHPPILNDGAIATLEGMRGRVRKIGLISNTGRSPGVALRKLLEKLGILLYFDITVFSDEVGFRKPDRRIFDLAVKSLNAEPGNVIHIGDNPEADVWGAKRAGMNAVLFDFPVPEEFKRQPGSLFALSRANMRVPDSEIRPDARITSLKDALGFVDSLV